MRRHLSCKLLLSPRIVEKDLKTILFAQLLLYLKDPVSIPATHQMPNKQKDRHTIDLCSTDRLCWWLTCLVSFLSLLCCSLLSISSGGMGSPEQVWGWALWAGRPGPFLVLSSFLHLALLFWNQTWKTKLGMKINISVSITNWQKYWRNQSIDWINHCKVFISLLCAALIVSNSCGMHFLWGKNSMIYRNFVKLKPCFSPGVTAPVLITK